MIIMQMPVPSTAGVHYRNTTLERQQSELEGTDCHQMQVFSTGVNTNNATLESYMSSGSIIQAWCQQPGSLQIRHLYYIRNQIKDKEKPIFLGIWDF